MSKRFNRSILWMSAVLRILRKRSFWNSRVRRYFRHMPVSTRLNVAKATAFNQGDDMFLRYNSKMLNRKDRRVLMFGPLCLAWFAGGCSSVVNIGYQQADETDNGLGETDSVSDGDSCTFPTLYVDGRYLHDVCGKKVTPIGINEMVVWSDNKDGKDIFPEIKKTGANTARFAWSAGLFGGTTSTPEELDAAITNCIANRMIAMPEYHDVTRDMSDIPVVTDWWVTPEIVSIIQKHEQFLMINIANGIGDDSVSEQLFIETYQDAVQRMRAAGIRVPLVIDASSFGANIDMLQATSSTLQSLDPLRNLMFGIHMWWAAQDGSTARIITELQASADLEMPLIVVEFAPMAEGCTQYIDVETILAECRKHGFGFFPWSWGRVNNDDCADMGMTTDGIFGDWRDTPNNGIWGEIVAITSPNSIQNQAVESAAFSQF